MKKIVSLSVVLIIIISLLMLIKFKAGVRTVEEAINPSGLNKINIIHEEKTDKGSIVFYNRLGYDELSTAFVKNGIMGYKVLYDGVQEDVSKVSKKFGITYCFFPAIEKTSLPIYFGIIGNPDISQVKIIGKKGNIEEQAKIIDAKGTRIWLIYMSKFKGSDFEIVGISKDGKELTKIDDNISPRSADQKPVKSTYK